MEYGIFECTLWAIAMLVMGDGYVKAKSTMNTGDFFTMTGA